MNAEFLRDISAALIKNPTARRTNTPIEVLATHMAAALELFEYSLIERAEHPFYKPGKERLQ